LGTELKEDDMDEAYVTHGEEETYMNNFDAETAW
jgi:hypothetical protein